MFLPNVHYDNSLHKHSQDAAECAMHCPADLDTRVVDLLFNRYVLLLISFHFIFPSSHLSLSFISL